MSFHLQGKDDFIFSPKIQNGHSVKVGKSGVEHYQYRLGLRFSF